MDKIAKIGNEILQLTTMVHITSSELFSRYSDKCVGFLSKYLRLSGQFNPINQ